MMVTVENGILRVQTAYNAGFVAAIKALPSSARRYDPETRSWLVDGEYADQVKELVYRFFGETVELGKVAVSVRQETRVCDVWYLGRTKPAGDEYQANGMNARKEWVFVFPEKVLREWFEMDSKGWNTTTFYGILGVHRNATEEEIKSAYRRMARQWHPDVCQEANAQEMFLRIKQAYDLLKDPEKRAKYNAGLALEASLKKEERDSKVFPGYRAPLRCGRILAEGQERLGRFYVQKILEWKDIISEKGTLVASWPPGQSEPVWKWV